MVESVGFSGLNTIQKLMAQKAFTAPKQQGAMPDENLPKVDFNEEKNVFMDILTAHESNILTKESVNEIKNVASSITANISDDDIKYGLKYGRSILVDINA